MDFINDALASAGGVVGGVLLSNRMAYKMPRSISAQTPMPATQAFKSISIATRCHQVCAGAGGGCSIPSRIRLDN